MRVGLRTGALIRSFMTCRGRINSVDITSDNQFAVVAIGHEPESAIVVVNIKTDKVVLKIEHENFHIMK